MSKNANSVLFHLSAALKFSFFHINLKKHLRLHFISIKIVSVTDIGINARIDVVNNKYNNN